MDYKKIYNEDYFSGKSSFFYSFGYGRFQKFYFDSLFRLLKPYIKKISTGKVLDIGCAYGLMLQRFSESFEKFGIDVSEHAIAMAKNQMPSNVFKIGNVEDILPFPADFFDIILCNDVLEHLEYPDRALKNILTVLKPGGFLYINTPNLNWLRRKVFTYADKKEHHISLFTHSDLYNLLSNTGFAVVDHWTYTTLTYFFIIKLRSNLGHESAFVCQKK